LNQLILIKLTGCFNTTRRLSIWRSFFTKWQDSAVIETYVILRRINKSRGGYSLRYFLIGVLLSVIGVLVSLAVWGIDKAYFISGGIGLFFIGISMVVSGSMVSGDQMRANFATESAEDRRNRNSVTFRTALIGIPNLVIAFLIYFFFK